MNSFRNAVAAAVLTLATVCCFQSAFAFIIGEPVSNPDNRHSYILLTPETTIPNTWDYANAMATAKGGHLVSIDNAAEAQWVLAQFGDGGTRTLWTNIPSRTIGAMPHYGSVFFGVIEIEPAAAPAPQLASTRPVVFNGHSYFVLTPSTWLQAQAKATSLGLALGRPTHLARIDNDAERAFVLAQFAVTQRVWIDGPGRFLGPTQILAACGLIEVDADLSATSISVTPDGAGTLNATAQVDLFAGVGTDVTPVAKDAPVATKKISWGDLKARYR